MEPKIPFIKRKYITIKLRKFRRQKHARFTSISEYRKILVVGDTINGTIEAAMNSLFPDCKVFLLQHRFAKPDQSTLRAFTVHHSDFSLSGNLRYVKLQKLLDEPFDLVIDLSQKSVALKWLVSQMKAKLTIGRSTETGSNYDLLVAGNPDAVIFLKDTKRQLELLGNGHK